MKDAPLPPCPLCGFASFREYSGSVHCARLNCRLWSGHLTEDQWRRLAAPPLPPEVVAVLRAAEAFRIPWGGLAYQGRTREAEPFDEAVKAWIAAGRPGLEKP